METFTDKTGRAWQIEGNFGLLRRVRDGGLDFDPFDVEAISNNVVRLWGDLQLTGELLWICVEKQALAADVQGGDFFELLDGDHVQAFREAFCKEWERFFVQSGQPNVAAVIKKMTAVTREIGEAGEKAIHDIDATKAAKQIQTEVMQEANQTWRNFAGSSLPSSESTPTGTPTES